MTAAACPNCGATLDGPYCAQCGQRAPQPGDLRFGHFFSALWAELTDLDSRSLRTLRAIFVPGELTRAYMAREWRRYLPPLRLYLITSAVFFLLCWDTLVDISQSIAAQDPAVVAQLSPAYRAALENPAVLDAASDYTAWARFAGVLLMAVWVALWQGPRRHPFGVHLAFATHFYVFDYVIATLSTPVWALVEQPTMVVFSGWMFGMFGLLWLWALLGLRRVYARGWAAAVIGAVAIVGADAFLSSLSSGVGMAIAVLTQQAG